MGWWGRRGVTTSDHSGRDDSLRNGTAGCKVGREKELRKGHRRRKRRKKGKLEKNGQGREESKTSKEERMWEGVSWTHLLAPENRLSRNRRFKGCKAGPGGGGGWMGRQNSAVSRLEKRKRRDGERSSSDPQAGSDQISPNTLDPFSFVWPSSLTFLFQPSCSLESSRLKPRIRRRFPPMVRE